MILNNYYYYSIKGIPEKTCDKIVKKFYSKKFHKGSIKGGSIKVRESEVIFLMIKSYMILLILL